jgi:hypothetical protein
MRAYPLDPDFALTEDGRVFRVRGGRARAGAPYQLSSYVSKRGYLTVALKDRQRTVHRLLAETFIPNLEHKPEVAHNDGVKLNIALRNLRWATRKENSDDMQLHGSRVAGERHPTSILTEAQARMIRELTRGKAPRARPYHRDLAAKYGVTRECISRIARGENWRHATA